MEGPVSWGAQCVRPGETFGRDYDADVVAPQLLRLLRASPQR